MTHFICIRECIQWCHFQKLRCMYTGERCICVFYLLIYCTVHRERMHTVQSIQYCHLSTQAGHWCAPRPKFSHFSSSSKTRGMIDIAFWHWIAVFPLTCHPPLSIERPLHLRSIQAPFDDNLIFRFSFCSFTRIMAPFTHLLTMISSFVSHSALLSDSRKYVTKDEGKTHFRWKIKG
jgi:hypothetical protein